MANPPTHCPPLFMSEICPICVEEFSTHEEIYVAGKNPVNDSGISTCGHVFHGSCLSDWFKTQMNNEPAGGSCPMCNRGSNLAFSLNGRRTIVYGIIGKEVETSKFVQIFSKELDNPFSSDAADQNLPLYNCVTCGQSFHSKPQAFFHTYRKHL